MRPDSTPLGHLSTPGSVEASQSEDGLDDPKDRLDRLPSQPVLLPTLGGPRRPGRMSGRMDHDGAFKNVFSEPRMMADFIRGFVGKSWVERANFSTLAPVGTEHVSDRRRGGLAWRLELDDGSPQYVVVMLELQSTVEAVVLYTGRERWDWSLRLSDLCMPCPEDVAARQLGIECTLVQACHERDLDLEPLNLSDAVFRLLRGTPAEVADMASRLQRRLAGQGGRSLLGAITELVRAVVLPTRAPSWRSRSGQS